MDRIGVRELRQNASRYLARVAHGETFEVTDRGRPVARLVPVPEDRFQALLDAGRIIPPEDDRDIADHVPKDFGIDASSELARMREHEQ